MGLYEVLADTSANLSRTFNQPEPGVRTPGSNYVALGLVNRNTLPDFGTSFTPPGGTAATLTPATVANVIKQLAFFNLATFFGNYSINGKKGLPDEFMEAEKYGTRTMERTTGDIKDDIEFTFKHMYLNVGYFNGLRSGLDPKDVYIFTTQTVIVLRYDTDEVVFHKIGHTIDGDITKEISGKFSIAYSREGEPIPAFGVREADLASESMRYTFGAYGTVTGATNPAGQPDRFVISGATAANFTRPVNEGGAVSYVIFRDNRTAITNEKITINTLTGKVDIGADHAAGRYVYTIVAMNASGVFGKYQITVDKS